MFLQTLFTIFISETFTQRMNGSLCSRLRDGGSLLSLWGGFKESKRWGGERFSTWCSKSRCLFVQTLRFSPCLSSLTFCQNPTPQVWHV